MTTKYIIIIIKLFIVQCWTQASKLEPLKQDTPKYFKCLVYIISNINRIYSS